MRSSCRFDCKVDFRVILAHNCVVACSRSVLLRESAQTSQWLRHAVLAFRFVWLWRHERPAEYMGIAAAALLDRRNNCPIHYRVKELDVFLLCVAIGYRGYQPGLLRH